MTASVPGARLWPTVWKLLRLRIVIWVGSVRRASLRGKIGMGVLALVVLGGVGLALFLTQLVLRVFRSPEVAVYLGDMSALINAIPVLAVSAVFVGLLFTSFGLLLQALYLAGDMDFLLSAPVSIRAVFVTKLLQAILPNFGLTLLIGLPVLYGLGYAGGYHFLYYPLVLIVMAVMALASAGLASLLVMSIVRIFPARRVAEVLGLIAGLSSFICSQSGQFAQYSDIQADQALQAVNFAARLDTAWSPLAWAGRGLVAIGEMRWLVGIGLLAASLGLAGAIFAISLRTAENLYYSGWAGMQVQARRKKTRRRNHQAAGKDNFLTVGIRQTVPAPVRAIVAKDWLVMRRDLRNMSQLITPIILGVVYSFMIFRSGEAPSGIDNAPLWLELILRDLFFYGSIGISLFVGWILVSRLAIIGFSQEGKSYWILKASPVSVQELLLGKFLVAFIPGFVMGAIFMLVLSVVRGLSLGVVAYGLAVLALAMTGIVGINLAFGVVGAKFDWDDPRRMSQGASGCLGSLLGLIYVAASQFLYFAPPLAATAFGFAPLYGQIAGLILGGSLSLAAGIIPLWLVRKRVPRLAE